MISHKKRQGNKVHFSSNSLNFPQKTAKKKQQHKVGTIKSGYWICEDSVPVQRGMTNFLSKVMKFQYASLSFGNSVRIWSSLIIVGSSVYKIYEIRCNFHFRKSNFTLNDNIAHNWSNFSLSSLKTWNVLRQYSQGNTSVQFGSFGQFVGIYCMRIYFSNLVTKSYQIKPGR